MKIGDRVVYVGAYPQYIGKRGNVVDVSSKGLACMVLFDGEDKSSPVLSAELIVTNAALVPVLDADAADMETSVTAAVPEPEPVEVDYLAITRSFCR